MKTKIFKKQHLSMTAPKWIFCLLLIQFLMFNLTSNAQLCGIYEDQYSTMGNWIQVGTKVVISGGRVNFNNIHGNQDNRVYHFTDTPLGTNDWTADFSFSATSGSTTASDVGVAAELFCLTSQNINPNSRTPNTNNNSINVVITGQLNPQPPDTWQTTTCLVVGYRLGLNPMVSSATIPFPTFGWGLIYYARLERISCMNLLSLSVFTNANRTNHIPGSPVFLPIPATLNLSGPLGTYLQHSDDNNAGLSRCFTGWVDSTCISPPNCFAATDSLYTKILTNRIYSSDMVWAGKMYIGPNVTITVNNNALLDITNVDVVFDQCAGIVFTGGGYMRANNSVFRPCNICDTWRGLRFFQSNINPLYDNIVNECTFKNAEFALCFDGTADAVISNNLFSNCNFGIRIEHVVHPPMTDTFGHPITGNQFITDEFFPVFENKCPPLFSYHALSNTATEGIYSRNSQFLYQLSHNEFVNAKLSGIVPNTFGIHQISGGGIFSANIFTDLYSPIYLMNPTSYSCIENNEVESNVPVANFERIRVDGSAYNFAIVEVNNNKLWNNYNRYLSQPAAISTSNSYVSIINNKIGSYACGINAFYNTDCQISSNEITDCGAYGIHIRETPGKYQSTTRCNTITMNNYQTWSRGLWGQNMSSGSEVYSNCIFDCFYSMLFDGTGGPLPKIRNNFLYNYTSFGIGVRAHSGNIGTLMPPSPGLNTLYSNRNTATDIASTSSIIVADNFGMFNITTPQVMIVSNRPYHSTASCSHQIYSNPSQGNLTDAYICSDSTSFPKITHHWPITGARGVYQLSPDYRELLKSSPDQYHDASIILANYDNSDVKLLNEIIELTTLSENQKALLRYNFYYRHADSQKARMPLNQFNPTNPDEADFKTLRLYDLDILENGINILSENDLEILRAIKDKKSGYSNFAITILNNFSTYYDYITEDVLLEEVVFDGDILHVESDQSLLRIYPNPVLNTVFIELVNTSAETSKIELFNMTGNLVTEYTINFMVGGIELDMSKLSEGLYFITLTDPALGFIQKGKMLKVNN